MLYGARSLTDRPGEDMADNEPALPPDEYLTPEQVQELRALLRGEAAKLLERGSQTVSDFTSADTQEADDLDVASSESAREFTLRLADRERRMLGKIRTSLQRIQDGEYGTCETCGGPIGYRRLLTRPVATQCIDCKTQVEQIEGKSRVEF